MDDDPGSESDGVADSIDEIPSEDQVSAAEQTDDTPESKYTSYKIVGDNIDKKVKPRHLRVDRQAQMLNSFHMYGVKARITPPESLRTDNPPSYGEFLCLSLEDILPTPPDKSQMLEDYCVLFARILCSQIPFFEKFSSCVPKHISHKYSSEMSQKSEVVS